MSFQPVIFWSHHHIAQDAFYKRHTPEEIALANASRFDFDHPDALDMPLFASVRQRILSVPQWTLELLVYQLHAVLSRP
jgi:uridine kinase